jgi:hypothetical protein
MIYHIYAPWTISCITRPDAFVRPLTHESGSRVWEIDKWGRVSSAVVTRKASSRGKLTILAIERRKTLVHLARALRPEQP